MTTRKGVIRVGKGVSAETAPAIPAPKPMPIAPPSDAIRAASRRNWTRTWRLRAPRAMRIPISRVRSVTDTSMMLAMTIPPTTRLIPEMITITANRPIVMLFQIVRIASPVTIPKGSFPRNGVWRRARRIARTSSCASGTLAAEPARTKMSRPRRPPNAFW